MGEQRLIIAGWYTVDPEARDEVVASFEDLVLRARGAPGCLDFAITADIDPSRINMFEFWRSAEDLNAWRAVANPPRNMPPMHHVEVQKHVIEQSGPPFES